MQMPITSPSNGNGKSETTFINTNNLIIGTTTESTTTTFAPVIYGRKFVSVAESFSLYYGAKLSFGSSKTTGNSTSNSFGIGLPIGAAFAVAPRFGIVGEYGLLSYVASTNYNNGNKTTSTSTVDFGVNTLGTPFTVGIYYTFKQ